MPTNSVYEQKVDNKEPSPPRNAPDAPLLHLLDENNVMSKVEERSESESEDEEIYTDDYEVDEAADNSTNPVYGDSSNGSGGEQQLQIASDTKTKDPSGNSDRSAKDLDYTYYYYYDDYDNATQPLKDYEGTYIYSYLKKLINTL